MFGPTRGTGRRRWGARGSIATGLFASAASLCLHSLVVLAIRLGSGGRSARLPKAAPIASTDGSALEWVLLAENPADQDASHTDTGLELIRGRCPYGLGPFRSAGQLCGATLENSGLDCPYSQWSQSALEVSLMPEHANLDALTTILPFSESTFVRISRMPSELDRCTSRSVFEPSTQEVRAMAARRQLPAKKLGKAWRFDETTLREWLQTATRENVRPCLSSRLGNPRIGRYASKSLASKLDAALAQATDGPRKNSKKSGAGNCGVESNSANNAGPGQTP